MKDINKKNGEILNNGYTIIHKTLSFVLAFKKIGNFIEYATWRFAPTGDTVFGNYFYCINKAIEDYKERVVIIDSYKDFDSCIKKHRDMLKKYC